MGEEAARRRLAGIAQVLEVDVELMLPCLDGVMVGLGAAIVSIAGDTAHVLRANVVVVPDARRRGIWRALVAWALGVAGCRGRCLVLDVSHDMVPVGEAFARALGAREGMRSRVRSRVDELDLQRCREQLFSTDGFVAC